MTTELALRAADAYVFTESTLARLIGSKASSTCGDIDVQDPRAGNVVSHAAAGDLIRAATRIRRPALTPAQEQTHTIGTPQRVYPSRPLSSLDEVWADMDAARVVGVDWEAALNFEATLHPIFRPVVQATPVPHLAQPSILDDIWDPVLARIVVEGNQARPNVVGSIWDPVLVGIDMDAGRMQMRL